MERAESRQEQHLRGRLLPRIGTLASAFIDNEQCIKAHKSEFSLASLSIKILYKYKNQIRMNALSVGKYRPCAK